MSTSLPLHVIEDLLYAAIQAGLDRKALLGGMPPGFTASLPLADTPAAQILGDLHVLNRTDALTDGSVPLVTWLRNATTLTTFRPEGAVFMRALQMLTRSASPGGDRPHAPTQESWGPAVQPAADDKSTSPVRIFISASDEDRPFVAQLERHLTPLRRARQLTIWHRGLIRAGSVRVDEIASALAEADAVLVILSADYLADDETYREGELALRTEKIVIPILARPVVVKMSPFASRKGLPGNGVPVSGWPDADSAFTEIAEALKDLVEARVAGAHRGW